MSRPGVKRGLRVDSRHYAIQRPYVNAGFFWGGLGLSPTVVSDEYLKGAGYCDLVVYPDSAWREGTPALVAEVKVRIHYQREADRAVNQVRRYRDWFIRKNRGRPAAYVVCPEIAEGLTWPDDVQVMVPRDFDVVFGDALRGVAA